MNDTFHLIDRTKWERDIYFDYYYNRIKCRYTLNANIDITELAAYRRHRGLKFFPTMLYAIMRVVNANKEFRMDFDSNNRLGYWEEVVPSYTVFHDKTKTFTDVWSEYDRDFSTFYDTVLRDMETYGGITGVIKARPGQPRNFCPVSCLPWLSYTAFAQDTYVENSLLFPLIKFGKYFERHSRLLLPFSVSVHHAAADGYHTCKLINDVQEMVADPSAWFNL